MPLKRDLIRETVSLRLQNVVDFPFLDRQPEGEFNSEDEFRPATTLGNGEIQLIARTIGVIIFEWSESLPISLVHQYATRDERDVQVNRWIDLVRDALYVDKTLGGNARYIELGPVSAEDEAIDGSDDLVQATMQLYVEWCSTDSRG